ncbi:MAG: hypothetical protein WKF84_29350 [Pyrinomonadaceae bacterium]
MLYAQPRLNRNLLRRCADERLQVLLVESRAAPAITFLVLYKVGSRIEAVGHKLGECEISASRTPHVPRFSFLVFSEGLWPGSDALLRRGALTALLPPCLPVRRLMSAVS